MMGLAQLYGAVLQFTSLLFLSSSEMFMFFATNLGLWYHTVIVYLFTKVVWAEGKWEEVMN